MITISDIYQALFDIVIKAVKNRIKGFGYDEEYDRNEQVIFNLESKI